MFSQCLEALFGVWRDLHGEIPIFALTLFGSDVPFCEVPVLAEAHEADIARFDGLALTHGFVFRVIGRHLVQVAEEAHRQHNRHRDIIRGLLVLLQEGPQVAQGQCGVVVAEWADLVIRMRSHLDQAVCLLFT